MFDPCFSLTGNQGGRIVTDVTIVTSWVVCRIIFISFPRHLNWKWQKDVTSSNPSANSRRFSFALSMRAQKMRRWTTRLLLKCIESAIFFQLFWSYPEMGNQKRLPIYIFSVLIARHLDLGCCLGKYEDKNLPLEKAISKSCAIGIPSADGGGNSPQASIVESCPEKQGRHVIEGSNIRGLISLIRA
jgi:hypothetical protein